MPDDKKRHAEDANIKRHSKMKGAAIGAVTSDVIAGKKGAAVGAIFGAKRQAKKNERETGRK